MDIKSQLQDAFFAAAAADPELDVRICYLKNSVSESRLRQGFLIHPLESYEIMRQPGESVPELRERIPQWRERLHIISYTFSTEIIRKLIAERVKWCHWSEMPGIGLARLVGFRCGLSRLLLPLLPLAYLRMGYDIRRHALGAFGHGKRAMRFFEHIGVPENRTAMLCYCTAPMPEVAPDEEILRFAAGRLVFFSVAALNARKGIDVILKAMAPLSGCCLVLAGADQTDGCYERLVRHLGIEDKVLFLGARPADQTASIFAAGDILILASRFDGWGAVLNEAASVGKALISSDMAGAAYHLIQDNYNGYRVRAGSVPALRKAMSRYLAEPELYRMHGDRSRQIFLAEFTPQANVERLKNAIDQWER